MFTQEDEQGHKTVAMRCTSDLRDWTLVRPPTNKRTCHALFVFQDRLHGVFLPRLEDRPDDDPEAYTIYQLEGSIDSNDYEWQQLQNGVFPHQQRDFAAVVVDDKLWIIGGMDEYSDVLSMVEVFDLSEDGVRQVTIPDFLSPFAPAKRSCKIIFSTLPAAFSTSRNSQTKTSTACQYRPDHRVNGAPGSSETHPIHVLACSLSMVASWLPAAWMKAVPSPARFSAWTNGTPFRAYGGSCPVCKCRALAHLWSSFAISSFASGDLATGKIHWTQWKSSSSNFELSCYFLRNHKYTMLLPSENSINMNFSTYSFPKSTTVYAQ